MNSAGLRAFQFGYPIGVGVVGPIWSAHATADGGLDLDVVLEDLGPAHQVPDGALEALQQDGARLAIVPHPGILRWLDVARLDGRSYAMWEGTRARALPLLWAEHPIPARVSAAVLAKVAGALEAATDSGVPPHGYLRPHAVWVGRHGQVKVVGFGLGALTVPSPPAAVIAPYLPPERRWSPARTPAGDVYAWGCVLFEALSGQPFVEVAHTAERWRLAQEPAAWSAFVDRRLEQMPEPAGRDLLRRCLAGDPAARPGLADLREWAEALAKSLGGPSLRSWQPVLPQVPLRVPSPIGSGQVLYEETQAELLPDAGRPRVERTPQTTAQPPEVDEWKARVLRVIPPDPDSLTPTRIRIRWPSGWRRAALLVLIGIIVLALAYAAVSLGAS